MGLHASRRALIRRDRIVSWRCQVQLLFSPGETRLLSASAVRFNESRLSWRVERCLRLGLLELVTQKKKRRRLLCAVHDELTFTFSSSLNNFLVKLEIGTLA